MAEHPKQVVQGSDIVFQITTNEPASVFGHVEVVVDSVDGGPTRSTNSNDLGTSRTATATLTMPLDAKTGKWKVVKMTFHADSGGVNTDLTPSGDLTFEVTPHGTLTLPSQASVEIR
jgi:hypothetical protein